MRDTHNTGGFSANSNLYINHAKMTVPMISLY